MLCGTVNSFLIWHLTGGRDHVTDHTNAARMLLMNLSTRQWDPELLDLFEIPSRILPRIVPTTGTLGEARFGRTSLPITCSIGDQQSASVGLGCMEKGDLTLNYGTGGFVLLNTGKRLGSRPGLLSSIAWSSAKEIAFLLEGTVNSVGSVLEWLRSDLKMFENMEALSRLCRSSRHRVLAIPTLTGLGAPYWREDLPMHFANIQRQTKPADLIRSVVEGIAFQMEDILETMKLTRGSRSRRIRAGGGIARVDELIQFQADLLQRPIERPAMVEATCLGAACLAGLGLGLWSSPHQIQCLGRKRKIFQPRASQQLMRQHYRQWKRLLQQVMQ